MDNLPKVWYAIPSARPKGGTLPLWRERGYKIACQVDFGADPVEVADICWQEEYEGYAKTVNALAQHILKVYPETMIVVTGGDDIEPPDADPLEVQREFAEEFEDLYGIMQPTGDYWMVENGLSCSERVAYSPWMGRAWIMEANEGHGPLWEGYPHFFVDEELQRVALKQDVFWQRKELTQKHNHWQREPGGKRPAHLLNKDRPELWNEAKLLFESRVRAGFPGSERKHAEINT